MTSVSTPSVTGLYSNKASLEGWQENDAQLKAAAALDSVRARVIVAAAQQHKANAEHVGIKRLLHSFLGRQPHTDVSAPKGCYIYGPVGRGKTMLMDMLAETMPEHTPALRCHFHSFMRNAHLYMKQYRSEGAIDPVRSTVDILCGDAKILCFDEFQIFDIGDAMLLYRLFEHIFSKGIALTATSNTHVEHLYKDGLQREHVLPFIALLEEHCEIITLETPHDYRTTKTSARHDRQRYFLTSTPGDTEQFTRITAALAHRRPVEPAHELFPGGRTSYCGEKAGRVLYTTVQTLCDVALGVNDYDILASRYSCFVCRSLPGLTDDDKQMTIRLIHLIDVLYERGRSLYCLADHVPAEIWQGTADRMPPGTARLCSRLHEMQSAEYIKLTCDNV